MTSLIVRPALGLAIFALFGLYGCSGESAEKSLGSARQYLAVGNSKAAIIQLKNSLQKSPDSAEARYLLGKSLLESQDPASAAIELGKASSLKYPPDAVAPLMAKALLLQGESKKVIDQFDGIALSAPASIADLKTTLAAAFLSQRERTRAETAFQAAFAAIPDYPGALMLRARLLASDGDMAGAKKTLDGVLDKAPGDADAWTLAGDLLLREGNADKAIDAYRKAIAARADSLSAHVAVVSIYLSRNDLNAAKGQLDDLKKVRPNHQQTRYLEAQWTFQNGEYKLADEMTQQLLKSGDNPRVLQLAGAIALQKGAFPEAEQSLSRALKAAPELTQARKLLAQVYAKSGKPANALETLAPLLAAREPDAQTLAMAATSHLQTGDAEKAERLFSRAVKLNPDDARSRTALALIHLYRDKSSAAFTELESIAAADPDTTADMALIAANVRRNDFPGALTAVDRVEKKQPGKPLASNLRGRVLLVKGDFDGARKSFEQALSRDPTNFAATDSLVALDLRDNKAELAEQRFDSLLARQPDSARAFLGKAQLAARAGKGTEEVVALLAKAVKARPNEVVPRLLLINYQLQQQDSAKALASAQDAVIALPNNLQVLEVLGRAQLATGDHNQAIASFNKLAAALPTSPEVRIAVADAYLAAERRDEAVSNLKEALQVSPKFLPAQQRLATLQAQMGRRSEAMSLAREVQKQRPKQAAGWLVEGDIKAADKDWAGATSLYRTALEKEALTDNAKKLHAALVAGGKGAEAETQAAHWLKAHPKDAAFVLYLGSRAIMEQRIAEADALFERLLKMQPDNPVALNNLAWTSAKLGKPQALELAERADTLKPGQPVFLDTLAMVLRQGKNLRKAIEVQSRVVKLQPQNHAYRLSLAQMLVEAGDKALARKELDELAQLGSKFPHQDEVEALRARL
jgi:putative PEP-CTERM system TPR-repeat lipoprotein